MSIQSDTYRLRTGGGIAIPGKVFIQTFMAEHNEIIVHEATQTLLKSGDMAGQGGDYISANYTRLPYLLNGEQVFSGKEVKKPDYLDEDPYLGPFV